MEKITREEWDDLTADEKWEYVRIIEQLLIDRQRVLAAIPECPEHGECVPHAVQWVEKMKRAEMVNKANSMGCR